MSDFWSVIASVSDENKIKLFEFEKNRAMLNYYLSTTSYEVARLKTLIDTSIQWKEMIYKT